MTYHYAGRSGDPFVGATILASDDCAALSEGVLVRPIADATVDSLDDEAVDWCPTCTDRGEPGPETCETVKSDGEVCGRELPCPYHSDD